MATVREIPPRKKEPSLKKVAAYCRISTRAQDQLDSLAAQEQYYEELIKANPRWQFVGIYSDVGSGTTIKGRKRLNASPNIPNAEVFLELFEKSKDEVMVISDSPVAQNRYFFDFVDHRAILFSDTGNDIEISYDTSTAKGFLARFLLRMGKCSKYRLLQHN